MKGVGRVSTTVIFWYWHNLCLGLQQQKFWPLQSLPGQFSAANLHGATDLGVLKRMDTDDDGGGGCIC